MPALKIIQLESIGLKEISFESDVKKILKELLKKNNAKKLSLERTKKK